MKNMLPILLFSLVIAAGSAFAENGPHVSMKCDTNNDGKVTKEEHRAEADRCFDKADTNSDGVVTQEEVTACHAKMKAENKGNKGDKGDRGDRANNPGATSNQSPESKPGSGDTKPGGPTRTEGGEQPGSTNPSTKNNATE